MMVLKTMGCLSKKYSWGLRPFTWRLAILLSRVFGMFPRVDTNVSCFEPEQTIIFKIYATKDQSGVRSRSPSSVAHLGFPTLKWGVSTYCLANFFPKTAWKLSPSGGGASSLIHQWFWWYFSKKLPRNSLKPLECQCIFKDLMVFLLFLEKLKVLQSKKDLTISTLIHFNIWISLMSL